ncbi:GNAT family N-acetyltransferase [Nocardia stercoris]|uniref:SecA family profile domain-containing protein n=1 Tax=Nocardia stercoris TaxID=2483361 RepID=A0A3M2L4M5_9NOCA|nr:GNAT family N-acetyltransferase [Nocardia stercoris]RMI32642.1 hypothetical protein EBN03_11765 [Nocardia stercoris]
MTLKLPPDIPRWAVAAGAGQQFPEMDEDLMHEVKAVLEDTVRDLDSTMQAFDDLMRQLAAAGESELLGAVQSAGAQITSIGREICSGLDALAKEVEAATSDAVFSKVEVIVALSQLVAQAAAAVMFPATAGAEDLALFGATRAKVRGIIETLVSRLGGRGLRLAALAGAVQGTLPALVAQLAAYHSVDVGKLVPNAVAGGVGGVTGFGVGHALSPVVSRLDQRLAEHLDSTLLLRIARAGETLATGGVAGAAGAAAGAAAASPLSHEKLTWGQLIGAAGGGLAGAMIGGAVHAANGHAPGGTTSIDPADSSAALDRLGHRPSRPDGVAPTGSAMSQQLDGVAPLVKATARLQFSEVTPGPQRVTSTGRVEQPSRVPLQSLRSDSDGAPVPSARSRSMWASASAASKSAPVGVADRSATPPRVTAKAGQIATAPEVLVPPKPTRVTAPLRPGGRASAPWGEPNTGSHDPAPRTSVPKGVSSSAGEHADTAAQTSVDGPGKSATGGGPHPEQSTAHEPGVMSRESGQEIPADAAAAGLVDDGAGSPPAGHRSETAEVLADFHARSGEHVPQELRLCNLPDEVLHAGLFSLADPDLDPVVAERESQVAMMEIIRRRTVTDELPGGKVMYAEQVEAARQLEHRPVEMKPGAGKTLTFLAYATRQALRHGSYLQVTTEDGLAFREYTEYKRVLAGFGIDVFLADQNTGFGPVVAGRPAIVVATGETTGHLCNAGHEPPRHVGLDELDAIIDRGEKTFIRSEGVQEAAPDQVRDEVLGVHDFLAEALGTGALSHEHFGLTRFAEEIDIDRPDGTVEVGVQYWYDGQAKLTPQGIEVVRQLPGGRQWLRDMGLSRLEMAAAAEFTCRSEVHYTMSPQGKIVIIDQGEHGLQDNPKTTSESRWSAEPGKASLAQAIEAKEIRAAEAARITADQHRIVVRADPDTAKSITAQEIYGTNRFFDHVTGGSGTLTDLGEVLTTVYGLPAPFESPRSQEHRLVEGEPEVVANTRVKLNTIADYAVAMRDAGQGRAQAILCHRNDLVRQQYRALVRAGIPEEAIEAVDARRMAAWGEHREAELQKIVEAAGQQGKILVINRQGQRGVDIPVSDAALARGGLHVWMTEVPEQSYIWEQGKNRTARNGQNGTAQALMSPQDALLRKAMHLDGVRSAVIQFEQAAAAHHTEPTPATHDAVLDASHRIRSLVPELQRQAHQRATEEFIRRYRPHDPAAETAAGLSSPRQSPPVAVPARSAAQAAANEAARSPAQPTASRSTVAVLPPARSLLRDPMTTDHSYSPAAATVGAAPAATPSTTETPLIRHDGSTDDGAENHSAATVPGIDIGSPAVAHPDTQPHRPHADTVRLMRQAEQDRQHATGLGAALRPDLWIDASSHTGTTGAPHHTDDGNRYRPAARTGLGRTTSYTVTTVIPAEPDTGEVDPLGALVPNTGAAPQVPPISTRDEISPSESSRSNNPWLTRTPWSPRRRIPPRKSPDRSRRNRDVPAEFADTTSPAPTPWGTLPPTRVTAGGRFDRPPRIEPEPLGAPDDPPPSGRNAPPATGKDPDARKLKPTRTPDRDGAGPFWAPSPLSEPERGPIFRNRPQPDEAPLWGRSRDPWSLHRNPPGNHDDYHDAERGSFPPADRDQHPDPADHTSTSSVAETPDSVLPRIVEVHPAARANGLRLGASLRLTAARGPAAVAAAWQTFVEAEHAWDIVLSDPDAADLAGVPGVWRNRANMHRLAAQLRELRLLRTADALHLADQFRLDQLEQVAAVLTAASTRMPGLPVWLLSIEPVVISIGSIDLTDRVTIRMLTDELDPAGIANAIAFQMGREYGSHPGLSTAVVFGLPSLDPQLDGDRTAMLARGIRASRRHYAAADHGRDAEVVVYRRAGMVPGEPGRIGDPIIDPIANFLEPDGITVAQFDWLVSAPSGHLPDAPLLVVLETQRAEQIGAAHTELVHALEGPTGRCAEYVLAHFGGRSPEPGETITAGRFAELAGGDWHRNGFTPDPLDRPDGRSALDKVAAHLRELGAGAKAAVALEYHDARGPRLTHVELWSCGVDGEIRCSDRISAQPVDAQPVSPDTLEIVDEYRPGLDPLDVPHVFAIFKHPDGTSETELTAAHPAVPETDCPATPLRGPRVPAGGSGRPTPMDPADPRAGHPMSDKDEIGQWHRMLGPGAQSVLAGDGVFLRDRSGEPAHPTSSYIDSLWASCAWLSARVGPAGAGIDHPEEALAEPVWRAELQRWRELAYADRAQIEESLAVGDDLPDGEYQPILGEVATRLAHLDELERLLPRIYLAQARHTDPDGAIARAAIAAAVGERAVHHVTGHVAVVETRRGRREVWVAGPPSYLMMRLEEAARLPDSPVSVADALSDKKTRMRYLGIEDGQVEELPSKQVERSYRADYEAALAQWTVRGCLGAGFSLDSIGDWMAQLARHESGGTAPTTTLGYMEVPDTDAIRRIVADLWERKQLPVRDWSQPPPVAADWAAQPGHRTATLRLPGPTDIFFRIEELPGGSRVRLAPPLGRDDVADEIARVFGGVEADDVRLLTHHLRRTIPRRDGLDRSADADVPALDRSAPVRHSNPPRPQSDSPLTGRLVTAGDPTAAQPAAGFAREYPDRAALHAHLAVLDHGRVRVSERYADGRTVKYVLERDYAGRLQVARNDDQRAAQSTRTPDGVIAVHATWFDRADAPLDPTPAYHDRLLRDLRAELDDVRDRFGDIAAIQDLPDPELGPGEWRTAYEMYQDPPDASTRDRRRALRELGEHADRYFAVHRRHADATANPATALTDEMTGADHGTLLTDHVARIDRGDGVEELVVAATAGMHARWLGELARLDPRYTDILYRDDIRIRYLEINAGELPRELDPVEVEDAARRIVRTAVETRLLGHYLSERAIRPPRGRARRIRKRSPGDPADSMPDIDTWSGGLPMDLPGGVSQAWARRRAGESPQTVADRVTLEVLLGELPAPGWSRDAEVPPTWHRPDERVEIPVRVGSLETITARLVRTRAGWVMARPTDYDHAAGLLALHLGDSIGATPRKRPAQMGRLIEKILADPNEPIVRHRHDGGPSTLAAKETGGRRVITVRIPDTDPLTSRVTRLMSAGRGVDAELIDAVVDRIRPIAGPRTPPDELDRLIREQVNQFHGYAVLRRVVCGALEHDGVDLARGNGRVLATAPLHEFRRALEDPANADCRRYLDNLARPSGKSDTPARRRARLAKAMNVEAEQLDPLRDILIGRLAAAIAPGAPDTVPKSPSGTETAAPAARPAETRVPRDWGSPTVRQATDAARRRDMRQLPHRERRCVRLTEAGWTDREIAAAMRITPTRVRSLRHEASVRMTAWLSARAAGYLTADRAPAPALVVDDNLEHRRPLVEAAVERLDGALRTSAAAHWLRGLSIEETAAELGISPQTVRGNLNRAAIVMTAWLPATHLPSAALSPLEAVWQQLDDGRREQVREALSVLTPKIRPVAELYFGLGRSTVETTTPEIVRVLRADEPKVTRTVVDARLQQAAAKLAEVLNATDSGEPAAGSGGSTAIPNAERKHVVTVRLPQTDPESSPRLTRAHDDRLLLETTGVTDPVAAWAQIEPQWDGMAAEYATVAAVHTRWLAGSPEFLRYHELRAHGVEPFAALLRVPDGQVARWLAHRMGFRAVDVSEQRGLVELRFTREPHDPDRPRWSDRAPIPIEDWPLAHAVDDQANGPDALPDFVWRQYVDTWGEYCYLARDSTGVHGAIIASVDRDARKATILRHVVLPTDRGLGYGTQLLRTLSAALSGAGITEVDILLPTDAGSSTGDTVRWYESQGFAVGETLPDHAGPGAHRTRLALHFPHAHNEPDDAWPERSAALDPVPMGGLAVREMAPDRIAELHEVDKQAFGPDLAYPYAILRQLIDAHGIHTFVVENEQGHMVAYSMVAVRSDPRQANLSTADGRRNMADIIGVGSIKPGSARQAVESAVRWAHQQRLRTVQLKVDPRNGRAGILYEKVGFEVIEDDPHYYGPGARRLALEFRPELAPAHLRPEAVDGAQPGLARWGDFFRTQQLLTGIHDVHAHSAAVAAEFRAVVEQLPHRAESDPARLVQQLDSGDIRASDSQIATVRSHYLLTALLTELETNAQRMLRAIVESQYWHSIADECRIGIIDAEARNWMRAGASGNDAVGGLWTGLESDPLARHAMDVLAAERKKLLEGIAIRRQRALAQDIGHAAEIDERFRHLERDLLTELDARAVQTRKSIRRWRTKELAELRERRRAAEATARRLDRTVTRLEDALQVALAAQQLPPPYHPLNRAEPSAAAMALLTARLLAAEGATVDLLPSLTATAARDDLVRRAGGTVSQFPTTSALLRHLADQPPGTVAVLLSGRTHRIHTDVVAPFVLTTAHGIVFAVWKGIVDPYRPLGADEPATAVVYPAPTADDYLGSLDGPVGSQLPADRYFLTHHATAGPDGAQSPTVDVEHLRRAASAALHRTTVAADRARQLLGLQPGTPIRTAVQHARARHDSSDPRHATLLADLERCSAATEAVRNADATARRLLRARLLGAVAEIRRGAADTVDEAEQWRRRRDAAATTEAECTAELETLLSHAISTGDETTAFPDDPARAVMRILADLYGADRFSVPARDPHDAPMTAAELLGDAATDVRPLPSPDHVRYLSTRLGPGSSVIVFDADERPDVLVNYDDTVLRIDSETGKTQPFGDRSFPSTARGLFLDPAGRSTVPHGIERMAGTISPESPDTVLAYAELPHLMRDFGLDYDRHLADVRRIVAEHPEFDGIPLPALVAVRAYTGRLDRAVNDALRARDPDRTARLRPLLDAMVSGLRHLEPYGRPDQPRRTVRGIRIEDPAELRALLRRYRKGRLGRTPVHIDPAAVSTSVRQPFPGNVRFEILSEGGGRRLGALSAYEHEDEVLFPPGCRFEVLDAPHLRDGIWVIGLRQLANPGTTAPGGP